MKFIIRVPGSSANLGCGFDTLAIAVSVYLTVYVNSNYQNSYRIKNASNMDKDIDLDPETNLILKTAKLVTNLFNLRLPYVEITINNDIPLKRGIGSSSAAIVAGIVLADRLCNLFLSKEQMLNIGYLLEPHIDNISASLYGNLTISMIEKDNICGKVKIENVSTDTSANNTSADNTSANNTSSDNTSADNTSAYEEYKHRFINKNMFIKDLPDLCSSISLHVRNDVNISMLIPDYELETSKSREILPKEYNLNAITNNIQRSSMISHILTNEDLVIDDNIRYNLFKDTIHQLSRSELIPGVKKLFEMNDVLMDNNKNLLGIYLSGAGPCIGIMYRGDHENIINDILSILKDNGNIEWKLRNVKMDTNGYSVYGISYFV